MVAAAKPHAVSISAPTSPACKNPEYCPNSLRQANCNSALPSDASMTSIPSHSLNADVFEMACSFASAVSASIMTAPLPIGRTSRTNLSLARHYTFPLCTLTHKLIYAYSQAPKIGALARRRVGPVALGDAILVCLTERPMTGYELAKTFDASIGYFWRADHQQIYRELARLRD